MDTIISLKRQVLNRGWLTVDTSNSVDYLLNLAARKLNEIRHGKYLCHNGVELVKLNEDQVQLALFIDDVMLIPSSDVHVLVSTIPNVSLQITE